MDACRYLAALIVGTLAGASKAALLGPAYVSPGAADLWEAIFRFAQQRAVFMSATTQEAYSLYDLAQGKFAVDIADFPHPSKADPVYGPLWEKPRDTFRLVVTRFPRTRTRRSISCSFFPTSSRTKSSMRWRIGCRVSWGPRRRTSSRSSSPISKASCPPSRPRPGWTRVHAGASCANHFRQMMNVVIPLSGPILGTVDVMQFISAWNEFILPLIVIRDKARLPVMVELLRLKGEIVKQMGPLMVGYAIASVLVIVLFLFSMRLFVRGLTEGAVNE